MGPDAMILVFRMLCFKLAFALSCFILIKRISSSSLLSLGWCHLLIWGYWYFSRRSWFQLVLHAAQHFSWYTLHSNSISKVKVPNLMYIFPNLEPVRCPMSSSNSSFLTCIQVLKRQVRQSGIPTSFKNFLQFGVIHKVKGFSIVHKAEVDVFFWNSLAFSMIQRMLAIWSLVPLPFQNPACIPGSDAVFGLHTAEA